MGGGPPGFPQGFSCLVVLWIPLADFRFRLLGFHRLWLAFPKPFDYRFTMLNAVRNPEEPGPSVWPLSRSLAATKEIEFSFSSYCYLDVSVHSVPFRTLWIHARILEVCSSRFPHSEISGSMAVCASPKLIAAYHVFHRLLVPRHSPYALSCLTSHNVFTLFFRNFIAISLECFVVAIQRFVTFVTSFFENRKLIFSRLTLFLLYLYSVFKVQYFEGLILQNRTMNINFNQYSIERR